MGKHSRDNDEQFAVVDVYTEAPKKSKKDRKRSHEETVVDEHYDEGTGIRERSLSHEDEGAADASRYVEDEAGDAYARKKARKEARRKRRKEKEENESQLAGLEKEEVDQCKDTHTDHRAYKEDETVVDRADVHTLERGADRKAGKSAHKAKNSTQGETHGGADSNLQTPTKLWGNAGAGELYNLI
jgi:hypothetical protein